MENFALETAMNYGPWQTLSVGLACALLAFIVINLRNYLNKKNGKECSNSELKEDITALRQNIKKLFDRDEKIKDDVADIKAKVSFLYGRLNGGKQ